MDPLLGRTNLCFVIIHPNHHHLTRRGSRIILSLPYIWEEGYFSPKKQDLKKSIVKHDKHTFSPVESSDGKAPQGGGVGWVGTLDGFLLTKMGGEKLGNLVIQ